MKTEREKAAYWAGRGDAQVLADLFFAGRPSQSPPLLGNEELPVCRCGGTMSRNPHPSAGKMDCLLEVGAVWVCIPCQSKALHNWSVRATDAEKKLHDTKEQQDG